MTPREGSGVLHLNAGACCALRHDAAPSRRITV
jgi:hypothetical protein